MKRNQAVASLSQEYLFAEISRRCSLFLQKHPEAELLHLGIGDTTSPIPQIAVRAWQQLAHELGTREGYTGYEPYGGRKELRQALCNRFYGNMRIDPEELFVGDGAKSLLGRLALLFPTNSRVVIPEPAYPVYADSSIALGHRVTYLPAGVEEQFFPDWEKAPAADVVYFCAPHNPTGMMATKRQLESLIAYAKRHSALIIYDAAYATFVRNPNLPKSIYAIEGAQEVAIEVGSFSKCAGFSGIRLGWCVIPKTLRYGTGEPLLPDGSRLHATFFNGASSFAQIGGLALLGDEGWQEVEQLIEGYLTRARQLKRRLEERGYETFGGEHAPYLWIKVEEDGWEGFDHWLERKQIVTTPGIGFGPSCRHFLRLSALARPETITAALQRL